MSITLLIVIITALVTISAFNNHDLYSKLIFYPFGMYNRPNEYYRFITSGFIHADWNHLIFNMITLYFCGLNAESICREISSQGMYVVLYVGAIIVSSIPAFIKHKDHSYYRALGASGGVSAILFTTVYFFPWSKITFYFIPFGIPSIVFAILYLAYSAYMSKKGNDNIGHDAHLYGGVYGFVFAFLLDLKFSHGQTFLYELMHPHF